MAAPDVQGHKAEGTGCGDGPSVGAAGALPLPVAGGLGCLRRGGVQDAGLGGGQTTQKAAQTAPSPPCEKPCGKNVLNPQAPIRFVRHKLQGRFGKEFATSKAVAGWM